MMEGISSYTDNLERLVLERGSFCTLENVFRGKYGKFSPKNCKTW